jgi:hypothetical protein
LLKEFNLDIQRLFINFMLSDVENFLHVQSIFNHENFDKKLRPVAEFLYEHVVAYKTLPEAAQLRAVFEFEFEPIDQRDGLKEWFYTEFESFTRRRELERAILKSADLLEKGEFDPVEKIVKDAVQITLSIDTGTNYFADPVDRLQRIRDRSNMVNTGWDALDQILYGGFNRGDLQIFCGGSGCVTADTLVEIIELPIIPNP